MNINHSSKEIELDKLEQIERGKRIKFIRENELHMNKRRSIIWNLKQWRY